MRFHLQTLSGQITPNAPSGHGAYDTFEAAKAGADEHPNDWQEIFCADTGERWVRVDGGDWRQAHPALTQPDDAEDPNVAAASIINQIANRD